MQFSNNENKHCFITEKLTYNDNERYTLFSHDGLTGSNSGFHIYNNNKESSNTQQVSLLTNCLNIGTNSYNNYNKNLNVVGGNVLFVSSDTNTYPINIKGYKKLDVAFQGVRYNTGFNTGFTNDARGIHLSVALSNSLQMGEGEIYSSSDRRFKTNFL